MMLRYYPLSYSSDFTFSQNKNCGCFPGWSRHIKEEQKLPECRAETVFAAAPSSFTDTGDAMECIGMEIPQEEHHDPG